MCKSIYTTKDAGFSVGESVTAVVGRLVKICASGDFLVEVEIFLWLVEI